MPGAALRVIPFKKDIANAARFGQDARKYVVDFMAAAQREFSADYGRVSPSARYVRTGTLARGWRTPGSLRLGRDYVGELINRVPYSGYVQGAPGVQARVMKRKGWRDSRTIAGVAERQVNRRFRKTLFTP